MLLYYYYNKFCPGEIFRFLGTYIFANNNNNIIYDVPILLFIMPIKS